MNAICLRNISTHNLKNLSITLPHRKLYVITGVSGSGKSSLAFDTLYAEGQRRYIESVSAYARQFLERMPKPDVESADGIPPAIAIQAKNVISNARSTVGTQTEINDYLRALFSRAATLICPACETLVEKSNPANVFQFLNKNFYEQIARVFFKTQLNKRTQKYLKETFEELERQGFSEFSFDGKWDLSENLIAKIKSKKEILVGVDKLKISEANKERLSDSLESAFKLGRGEIGIEINAQNYFFSEKLKCHGCGKEFIEATSNLFSFNSPLGACPTCQGFGRVITIDWDLVVPDETLSLQDGAIAPWRTESARWEQGQLLDFCERKRISTKKSWKDLKSQHKKQILHGSPEDDFYGVQGFFDYLAKKTYKMHVRIFLNRYRGYTPCDVCGGSRLKPEALSYLINGKNIAEVQALNISELLKFLNTFISTYPNQTKIEPVMRELFDRTNFLNDVGLGYLTMDRMSRTLSGGEVERIHLASSLGSALVDTLYVLDEPSVGLHERDNQMLIGLLKKLRDLGNTVVVVEHDQTMIEAADEVLDLGPTGGVQGGHLLFQGSVENLKAQKNSLTGAYLSHKKKLSRKILSKTEGTSKIEIFGAKAHNLKGINVSIPLRKFSVLTGVSGSGKSTFLYEILYNNFLKFKGRSVPSEELGGVEKIKGFEHLSDMVMMDQSPLGRSPRSNSATFMKAFEDIRKIFANTAEAHREGFDAGHFSFNVERGRCDVCEGDGEVKVEMHFLADIFVPCEECGGKRFKSEILKIKYRGKNIDDVLNMTIDEALEFFSDSKGFVTKMQHVKKIGLGYLKLGQSTLTLSGGEAQRLKIAYELSERRMRNILYLLDEPTTGLHEDDVRYLLGAFDEILARGDSVLVIEHHMGLISLADYCIDLGPEGGNLGGEVLYQGDASGLLNCKRSYTGQCLKRYLRTYSSAT